MKNFLLQHKLAYGWLLADFVLLVAFWLTRENRAWMNAFANSVTTPLKKILGQISNCFSFSVMEVLYFLAACLIICYICWRVVGIFHASGMSVCLHRIWGMLLGLLNLFLTIYLGFCFLWGVNYYTDSFQDCSGIRAKAVTISQLKSVTNFFVDHLEETADLIPREESTGLFAASLDEIFEIAPNIYKSVEEQFPFLTFQDVMPKRMIFSKLMSAMNFTGVYCPFTGESNLNIDAPACFIPATIAHELAHQRGIASEQECNFLAVLVSVSCGDPVYEYSGWLMGYLHLSNALWRVDRDIWRECNHRLPEVVKIDLQANNTYWNQRRGLTASTSEKVYDTFLKSYGDEDGIQSYGTVVDLLIAYYAELPEI